MDAAEKNMNELSMIIEKTISEISTVKIPLEKVSTESEPMFINLGNELQNVFSDAEHLTALSRETAMLIEGDANNNILANIGDFSRQALGKLDICREDVTNVLPNIKTCSINLKRLRNMCPVIKAIAKKLNIVALHISMESSRSKKCEEMFNFFVKEIKQLAGTVQGVSNKILQDSDNVRAGQDSDFKNISARKDTLSDLADNAHEMVEGNVVLIEELITMALKVMKRAEIHSNKISSLVGDIVVAIQFHDIVRQQIEHVIETLDEVDTLFSEDRETTETDDHKADSLLKAYTILSLQAEQINQVIKEINDAYQKIKNSLNDIGKEVEELVNSVCELSINSNNDLNEKNPFVMLLSGLDQLNNILFQGKEMATIIEKNLKKSIETAGNLSGHLTQMEDISEDLHIKAINALIMSKSLGTEGQTLSILAEEVTAVSSDSNNFVLDVSEILKAISDLTSTFSCLSHDDESSLTEGGEQQITLSTGIRMLSNIYNDFTDKSTQSTENSQSLKDKILCLEPGLSFLCEMEETLSSQLKSINNIMKNIMPFLPEDRNISDDLAHLKSRYTMDIERGIHNRAFTDGSKEDDSFENFNEDINNPGDAEEDSLGDNIELF